VRSVQAHVLVIDRRDYMAYTSKTRILAEQGLLMVARGKPEYALSGDLFHYAVRYIPTNSASDTLHIVNVNSIADMAFDDSLSAQQWADHLRSRYERLGLDDEVRVTTVPLDRGGETADEAEALESMRLLHGATDSARDSREVG
jgi:hypothetical protein